ncbi:response regulator [Marinomonas epiphytica]
MKKHSTWQYWLPSAVFILGLAIALYSEESSTNRNSQLIESAVNESLTEVTSNVLSSLSTYEYGLRSLKAAIDAIGFNDFTYQKQLAYFESRDYKQEFPGARGIGLIKKVDEQNLANFVEQAQLDRNGNFSIKQLDSPKNPLFVIQYIEPVVDNIQAVGLDIGSEYHRRHAALISASTQSTQLTGPITLVQANQKTSHGFLLLHPVYKQESSVSANTLLGWTYAPLLIDEILDSVLASNTFFNFNISDVTTNTPIHFYNTQHSSSTLANDYNSSLTTDVFGRLWSIQISPTQSFIESLSLEDSQFLFWQITVASFLVSLLIFFIAHILSQRLVEMRQKLAFSAVVENASDCIIGVDDNFSISHWNSAADRLFNFSNTNAYNKPLANWLSASISTDKLINLFKQVANGSGLRSYNITYQSDAYEEERYLNLNISPLFDHGKFSGATVSFNDVSEISGLQKQLIKANHDLEKRVSETTEEIQRQLMLQSSILNSTYSAIIACDAKGKITLFNKMATTLLGYTAHQATDERNIASLINKNSLRVTIDSDVLPDNFYEEIRKESKVSNYAAINCELLSKQQDAIEVNLVVSPIWSGSDIEGYVFIANDLTEKQSMQRQLSLADSAISNSQDILLWVAPDGTVFNHNPFASTALERKPFDLKRTKIQDILTPKSNEPWEGIVDTIFSEGRLTFEADFITLSKTKIPTLISGCVIMVGKIQYIYLAAKNITQRLEAEKRIEDALIKADSANNAKTEFIANMSHELRTPLNAVNGYLQLLELTNIDEIQRKYILDGMLSVTTLTQIINDILDITYLEKDTLKLEKEDFELDAILSEVGAQLYSMVHSKPVEIHLSVAHDVPYALYGDQHKLKRILINIAGNAVKFTNEGEVIIQLSMKQLSDSNLKLHFSVKDTGIGISNKQLSSIFDMFTQVDNNAARHYGGIGLGLTISSQYIRLMEGDIHAKSEIGVGSEFSFDVQLEQSAKIQQKSLEQTFDRPINVLLVDDNATSLQILGETIEQLGWNITATTDPVDAVRIFQDALQSNYEFDLALIDWKMPGKDGWELAENIREIAPDNKLPLLIMVTAHSSASLTEQYSRYPNLLNGFLTKPVTRTQMVNAFLEAVTAANYSLNLASNQEDNQSLFNKRILVVEDNPTNQHIVQGLLESQGASTTIAPSGIEALNQLENSLLPFDVVLMDIQMPGMDGYQTTQRIKSNAKFTQLPIIAMTANVIASEKERCFDVGMVGHVSKPFNLTDVVQQILTASNNSGSNSVPQLEHKDLPHNIETEALSFCEKHNIDLLDAMERFNFMSHIYLRSLELFKADLIESANTLSNKNIEVEELKMLLHTLKSTSGSLGFSKLSKSSKNLEKNISDLSSITPFSQDISDLKKLLETSFEQVERLERLLSDESINTQAVVALDRTDFNERYQNLKTEVSSFNMHALDTFQEIALTLKSLSPELTEDLIKALNTLKFKDAEAIMTSLDELIDEEQT